MRTFHIQSRHELPVLDKHTHDFLKARFDIKDIEELRKYTFLIKYDDIPVSVKKAAWLLDETEQSINRKLEGGVIDKHASAVERKRDKLISLKSICKYFRDRVENLGGSTKSYNIDAIRFHEVEDGAYFTIVNELGNVSERAKEEYIRPIIKLYIGYLRVRNILCENELPPEEKNNLEKIDVMDRNELDFITDDKDGLSEIIKGATETVIECEKGLSEIEAETLKATGDEKDRLRRKYRLKEGEKKYYEKIRDFATAKHTSVVNPTETHDR